MARPVILGNGSLTVGIDEHGQVHDFYYPYVGLENLTTARSAQHKIGIWVDGTFSWVDDGSWDTVIDFETDALVSKVSLRHQELAVELLCSDFVDAEYDALCRKITVVNHSATKRDIRLFLHQVFEISRNGRADTALFVPDDNYILDYKGRCSLLIYGQTEHKQVFDQFAIGNYGIEGKEGTFRDAEDGELSGSAVEHGGVDSVLRFTLSLDEGASSGVDYWIVAADAQYSAEKVHNTILKHGIAKRLQQTRDYWSNWLSTGGEKLQKVSTEHLPTVKKSLMTIKAHIDKRGGIIASCDSSIYNYGRDYYSYVWPRDGAYAIWPLIRLGYTEEPKKFFEFCRDIMTPHGYLMHKYQPDRAIGSTWHPLLYKNRKELAIQEDETAIVIFMLGEYYDHFEDADYIRGLYDVLIRPAATFMSQFIDVQTGLPHASYDLWEEKFLTSTYTAAVTYRALLVAADFAEKFEHPDDVKHWRAAATSIKSGMEIFFDKDRRTYRKGYLLQPDGSLEFDNTLDISSFYGVMMFGLYSSPDPLHETVQQIENILLDQSPSGGAPRYEQDNYFKSDPAYNGNPWFVTTLWLAQYYARTRQYDKTVHYIKWTVDRALPSGALSEQVNPSSSAAVSVTPLVWSHAELVNTILDLRACS